MFFLKKPDHAVENVQENTMSPNTKKPKLIRPNISRIYVLNMDMVSCAPTIPTVTHAKFN
jgi:hypothetical protein